MSDALPYRMKDGEGSRRGDADDDEELDETVYKTVRDAVLFAIEVSPSMLKKPPTSTSKKGDNRSPLVSALTCAYHLMQQRIVSSPKDLMGVLLYGTEDSKYPDDDDYSSSGKAFQHCYVLTELGIPEASDIKALRQLVESEDPEQDPIFQPTKEVVPMHTVLFCANKIFQQRAANFASRRLFLITDNDNPHAESKAYRSQATVRAKDLYDLGVMIELFPISTITHNFDTKLFYDDVIYRSTPSDPDAILYNPAVIADLDTSKLKAGFTDGISLLQSLMSNIASKAAPKRALFSAVPLELAPDLKISVKGYLLYKKQVPARNCYIYLAGEKPLIAKGSTQQVTGETSRQVDKAEIRRAYTFGGEQVTFSVDEMKQMRDFGDPVIRVVGFKSHDKLPLWANIKNSTFLYPSEEDFVGSTRVYSALHRKLVKDSLFGLCWFIPRRNAVPVMAALVPTISSEENETHPNPAGLSATGAPQGLHLIPLPFADDIRQYLPTSKETPLRAPDELVDAMRPIIQQLNLPKGIFDPSKYPNPSLQWHYRILQALALDEDLPEVPEDKTKPKYKQIDKRVGNESIEWAHVLDRVYKEHLDANPGAANVGSKRGAHAQTNGGGGASVKKTKQDASANMDEAHIRGLWQDNKLGNLTVAQLKDFAAAKRIPCSGKKAEIVERIEAYFEKK